MSQSLSVIHSFQEEDSIVADSNPYTRLRIILFQGYSLAIIIRTYTVRLREGWWLLGISLITCELNYNSEAGYTWEGFLVIDSFEIKKKKTHPKFIYFKVEWFTLNTNPTIWNKKVFLLCFLALTLTGECIPSMALQPSSSGGGTLWSIP